MNPAVLEPVAAAARQALGGEGETHGAVSDDRPRFELFHAASSICSQKVRAVLAYHALPYRGHGLNMFAGQTYLPDYVRLRMLGCERYGGALVSHHSGSTSASAGSCDGAVVPTLIDWQAGEVVVDSKRICLYLDAQVAPADRLRPDDLAAAIDADLEVVDGLPNYKMLMGRTVKGSESAATSQQTGSSFSQRKVAWCTQYLADHADDPTLVAAYTAKRAKELSAAEELFSPEAMRAAYECAEAALAGLEAKLAAAGTPWLYGDRPTVAAMMLGMEASDIAEQRAVRHRPRTLRAAAPRIVAAGRDLEDPAHQPDRPLAGMIADEIEAHLGTSAKMPIAFFSTSRSMRVRSSSRFSRAISDAWSAGDGIGDAAGTAALDRAVPPRITARQFRNIDGEIPTSVATCISGRPLDSSSATVSRLNSGENSRLILGIAHPLALTGLAKVSTETRDHQAGKLSLKLDEKTKRTSVRFQAVTDNVIAAYQAMGAQ